MKKGLELQDEEDDDDEEQAEEEVDQTDSYLRLGVLPGDSESNESP